MRTPGWYISGDSCEQHRNRGRKRCQRRNPKRRARRRSVPLPRTLLQLLRSYGLWWLTPATRLPMTFLHQALITPFLASEHRAVCGSREGRRSIFKTWGSHLVNIWLKDWQTLFVFHFVVATGATQYLDTQKFDSLATCFVIFPVTNCFDNSVVGFNLFQVKETALRQTGVRWRHLNPLPDNHPRRPPPCRPAPAAVTSASHQEALREDFLFRFQKKILAEVITALSVRFCVWDAQWMGRRVLFQINVLQLLPVKVDVNAAFLHNKVRRASWPWELRL